MTCALELDPRFCRSITGERKNQVINLFSTTILNNYSKDGKNSSDPLSTNVFKMTAKVSEFMAQEHEMPDGTIFDFWRRDRHKYPEIYHLSQVVFAICRVGHFNC